VAKVKYENATAQDITMQYSDLKIRLDVQQKMLTRYQELLKKQIRSKTRSRSNANSVASLNASSS
jgi:hypothetical protein